MPNAIIAICFAVLFTIMLDILNRNQYCIPSYPMYNYSRRCEKQKKGNIISYTEGSFMISNLLIRI